MFSDRGLGAGRNQLVQECTVCGPVVEPRPPQFGRVRAGVSSLGFTVLHSWPSLVFPALGDGRTGPLHSPHRHSLLGSRLAASPFRHGGLPAWDPVFLSFGASAA